MKCFLRGRTGSGSSFRVEDRPESLHSSSSNHTRSDTSETPTLPILSPIVTQPVRDVPIQSLARSLYAVGANPTDTANARRTTYGSHTANLTGAADFGSSSLYSILPKNRPSTDYGQFPPDIPRIGQRCGLSSNYFDLLLYLAFRVN